MHSGLLWTVVHATFKGATSAQHSNGHTVQLGPPKNWLHSVHEQSVVEYCLQLVIAAHCGTWHGRLWHSMVIART